MQETMISLQQQQQEGTTFYVLKYTTLNLTTGYKKGPVKAKSRLQVSALLQIGYHYFCHIFRRLTVTSFLL
jgi:hypothetical protein